MKLTPHQQEVFEKVKTFIADREHRIFILKGYAGTGKTTLARFIIEYLDQASLGWSAVLLASTGRAARILSEKTGWAANTVHGHIYSFEVVAERIPVNDQDDSGQLKLIFGLRKQIEGGRRLYIVDEASMLSHYKSDSMHIAEFGSGRLLDDFIQFVGSADKIVFIGDPVQLPPVQGKDPFSPALNADFLRKRYQVGVMEAELTEVLRQQAGNSILQLATELRRRAVNRQYGDWESILAWETEGIFIARNQNVLIDRYLERVKHGFENGIIITHSNKQALFLNLNMRKRLHQRYQELPQPGEVLMVAQNSYHVPLSNGDRVLLKSVTPAGAVKGIKMLKVDVEALHNGQTYTTYLIQDFLFNADPNLSSEDARKLLIDFDQRARKNNLKRNSEPYKMAMRADPILNALRAKFGYAVTCHKAQGGEWPHCFLNLSETLDKMDPESRYRWLYTAVTRAKHRLDIKPVYRGIYRRR